MTRQKIFKHETQYHLLSFLPVQVILSSLIFKVQTGTKLKGTCCLNFVSFALVDLTNVAKPKLPSAVFSQT